jgi:hypothetical protein
MIAENPGSEMVSNLDAMMETPTGKIADLVRENPNSQPNKTTLVMCLLAVISFFMTVAKACSFLRRKYKEHCYGN